MAGAIPVRHGRPVRRPWWLLGGALFTIFACNSAGLSVTPGGATGTASDCTADESGCVDAGATDAGKKKDAGAGDAGTPAGTSSDISVLIEPAPTYAKPIEDAIRGATTSVHVLMYLLTDDAFIDALGDLHDQGVEVKVVLNKTFPTNSGDDGGDNSASFPKLQARGVDVVWASSSYTYTHAKTIVIDGKTAIIQTMNLAYSSPAKNREYIATDTDADDVETCEKIFAADYAGTPIQVTSKLTISPTSANTNGGPLAMLQTFLASATSSIDVEVQSITETNILNALINAQKSGVTVRVIASKYEDATAAAKLRAAGIPVKTLTTPYVHAKAVVVDGERMWLGSQNFTLTSLTKNREIGLFSANADEVAKVASTIASDFASGVDL